LTDFKLGDIVKVPWGKSIGVVTDYSDPYFIVKFVLHYGEPHTRDGGYLSVNLQHIT